MSVWLEYVAPSLGTVLSNVLFLSPLQSVRRLDSTKELGVHNPLPYLFMIFNCLGWIVYGVVCIPSDTALFIFASNILGLLLGIYYTMICYPLSDNKNKILTLLLSITAVFIILVFTLTASLRDLDQLKLALGFVANCFELLFFASPLSTIFEVLRSRSAESIHLPLSVTSLIATLMWVLYGWFVGDWFIAAPNLVTTVLTTAQVILHIVFRKPSKQQQQEQELPESAA
jgi:solute carrier family 50 protein (sugar transporter)